MPEALFVHGTSDGTIPFQMGEAVAGIYNGKKKFLPMPQYPHGDFFKGTMSDKFRKEIDELLKISGPGPGL